MERIVGLIKEKAIAMRQGAKLSPTPPTHDLRGCYVLV